MHRIRVSQIRPGQVLDGALCTVRGLVLLASGQTVTEEMCEILRNSSHIDLYLEQGPPQPVTTDGSLAEAVRLRARIRRDSDKVLREKVELWRDLDRRMHGNGIPIRINTESQDAIVRCWERDIEEVPQMRQQRVSLHKRMMSRLEGGNRMSVEGAMELIEELIDRITRHPSSYGHLAMPPATASDSLADHAYLTAVTAVGIAVHLNWSRWDVQTAGLAALFADAGMWLMPQDMFVSARRLTEVEWNRLRRHTQYSIGVIENLRGLPEEARIGAYQHHERRDGSGYPLGLKAGQIHEVAQVVAVADAYAAAIAPRPYREARLPFDAISELIALAQQGCFDRAFVRALVAMCGLFPVGSFVRLSDGRCAVVIAAVAGEKASRPIVQLLDSERTFIDLAAADSQDLRIVQAIDGRQIDLYGTDQTLGLRIAG